VRTTLLLADDSVTIQRVIELTFADENVQVIAVSDGDSAIARVVQQPPDIVLADAGMPGRNGYEIARYIKQSPRLAHIPVLLLTGAFEPVDEQKASEAGCDGVLAKPFEPQLVISRVRDLLARSRDGARGASLFVSAATSTGEPSAAPSPTSVADGGDPPSAAGSSGDFFERLDQAFATRIAAHPDQPESPEHTGGQKDLSPTEPAVRRAPPQPTSVPTPPPPRQPVPALADTFAALLAAEQRGNQPPDAASWAAMPPSVTDDLVERVARLVLERLSDQVVRETVADLTSAIAERLVREEIDRIKGGIK
jgi:CheY-like chemotaxis protein